MKVFRWVVVTVVVIGLILTLRWLFSGGDTEAGMSSPYFEREFTVTKGDIEVIVSANGTIRPINLVEIKSKASGQIVRLSVEEGDQVKRGGLITELDRNVARSELEQAKADLMVAEVNLKQARNNKDRAVELFERGLISAEEMDRFEVEYVRAQAQMVRSNANLRLAEERMDETVVRSPIDGIVLTKDVEEGQIISSGVTTVGGGTLISTIANMDFVHVVANVDEVDLGSVAAGQRVKVIADAYPDRVFTGEVVRIAPQGRTEQNITIFPVTIVVENRGGYLKSGMSADVEILIARRENVVMVPNEAVLTSDAMRRVGVTREAMEGGAGHQSHAADTVRVQRNMRFVLVREGDKFSPRRVAIGVSNYEFTEILSGMEEGEEILIRMFSYARQAGLEWQERMRQRTGFGGIGR